jgi:hypothetical protein
MAANRRLMIRRLQADADAIPIWFVGKAKAATLEHFLAHSEKMTDSEELIDFCLMVIATMKSSIDRAHQSGAVR